jgi:TetR/AcrR family transcriptional regulator, cholesterol catabolism regulator
MKALNPTKRTAAHDSTTPEGETRRQLILDQATSLFATQGFDKTTLTDIAAAAELHKPSLYHYFPSKDAILLAVLSDGMNEILGNARRVAQVKDPVERFRALFGEHLRNFERRRVHVIVFLLERRRLTPDLLKEPEAQVYMDGRHAYDHLFTDCIREGQRTGVFRAGDPSVLAYGILGMVNWMVQWYDPEGRMSMNAIGEILLECATSAIRAVPAG